MEFCILYAYLVCNYMLHTIWLFYDSNKSKSLNKTLLNNHHSGSFFEVLFVKIMNLPSGYSRMFDLVTELNVGSSLTDFLEHGCGDGSFVKFLREKRFNAYGIDVSDKHLQRVDLERGIVVHLASHAIGSHFNGQLFDFILANRILSEAAIGVFMAERYGPLKHDELSEIVNFNTRSILESSLNQLRPGKYFVGVADWPEKITVTPELVQEIGYKVVRLQPQEIILQKPFNT